MILTKSDTLPQVVATLTHLYLADVDDPLTRAALEAAAVVRRTTRPLLAATLGANAAQVLGDWPREISLGLNCRIAGDSWQQ